jgi:hypothetical protein
MKTKTVHAVWFAVFLSSSNLMAQESAGQRHEMATNQLKKVAADISARCLKAVRSLDDWKKQRPELRRQLLEMLGLTCYRAHPLNAQITGRLERELIGLRRLLPKFAGAIRHGKFLRPKGTRPGGCRLSFIFADIRRIRSAKFQYQTAPSGSSHTGLPVWCSIRWSSRGRRDSSRNARLEHVAWLSLGYTPAGVDVWNAIRALDYLETRPEVDARHIGLTGISGGGAMTWYTAAVDERISAAAPVCSSFTFGSQAEHWVARGQCDCIYYHNTYMQDFPVVGALIAPRPLLILSGQRDSIFPPDGYHEVYERAKRIYQLYTGVNADRIREVDDNVEHSDPPLFLREARQWMQHWLKGDATPLPEETNSPPKETAKDLACLAKLPADAINYKIQNQFTTPVILTKPGSGATWGRRRVELMAELQDKVFRWFPTEGQ